MCASRMVARQPAASFLPPVPLQAIVLAALPMPVCAGSLEPQATTLATGLTWLMGLVVLWRYKRSADQARRLGEARLAEARQELQRVTEQASSALQQARSERERLEQALFASEQRLGRHLECASELVFALDLDGCVQQLSANWRQALGVDPGGLLGQNHAWLIHSQDQPACQGAIERALASRSPQDEVEYRIRHAEGDWRWHAARIAPLFDANARMVGLLGVARELAADLRPDRRTRQRAHFDALTGLPGRSLCLDRLQQALRQSERHGDRVALLQVDLDRFQSLNQRWGHAVGDLVLLEAAARIAACVRASDTVGRCGGDTFMVLLPNVGSEREALKVADKIRRTLSEPLPLRRQALALTVSIGLAIYPDHGLDEDELFTGASQAVRLAKDDGRDRVACAVASPSGPERREALRA
ncbi:sensor domain-containing diguanylate cyclase [Malikia sp.]|uniref:sensor domain-containing diguanylate cyclase n=1 Tax=Malikia sp. TaxID=2070706 RepID=UPI0026082882|nr:sensor domain-containing diguanylate cyclase [Malikia sp.]MDD2729966.1 sensor domain-containing diguanylate cyclase [Malikia sp.]